MTDGGHGITHASAEADWLYLSSEAYEAEMFGIRALGRLLRLARLPETLATDLARQRMDEVRHARGYSEYVRDLRLPHSGFVDIVEEMFDEIDSLSGKLFLIQGLIEGLNIGLIRFRLASWSVYPTRQHEQAALSDEERHVAICLPYLRDLVAIDGKLSDETFDRTTRRVVKAFAETSLCQRPEAFVDGVASLSLPTRVEAADVREPRTIGRAALGTLLNAKKRFMRAYEAAAEG